MSGQTTAPTAEQDLATVHAGVQLAQGHPFVPALVARALQALLRLVTHQHQALQGMRRELDGMKGGQ